MTLLAETITLIISAMILAKAAHTVIKSSVTIAKITRLGELVTGFLILSIVSGFPELIISTRAAASGNSGIAIGSVLGSNITSICFVIGLIGFLRPITVTEETLKKLTTMLLLCCLSLVFLLISTYFRWVGIAFLFLYFFIRFIFC